MKFGQTLKKQRLTEWSRKYLAYGQLKKLIKRAVASREGGAENIDSDVDEDSQNEGDTDPQINDSRPPSFRRASSPSLPDPLTSTALQRIGSRASTASRASHANTEQGLRFRKKTGAPSTIRTNKFRFPPAPIDQILPKLNSAERKFFTVLYSELDKVSSFYNEREAQAADRLTVLETQLDELEHHRKVYYESRIHNRVPLSIPKPALNRVSTLVSRFADAKRNEERDYAQQVKPFRVDSYTAAKKALKSALLEEYKLIAYIRSYRVINRTGFSKILKKFEKATNIPCSKFFMQRVNTSNFVQSTRIDELGSKVEQLFAQHFTNGSRKRALERLRFEGQKKTHHFASARAGFYIGLAIFPLVAGLYQGIRPDAPERILSIRHPLLQLFGAFSLPVIFAMLVSINLSVWIKARINYSLIFELDDRGRLDFRQFLELPAFLFCLLCYAFWLALSDFWPNTVRPWNFAYAWFIIALLILLNPFPGFHVDARWWFLRRLGRVALAGISRVEFCDFWIGDLLVSQSYFLYNLGFLVCTWHRDFNGVPPRCDTNSTWVSPLLASLPAFFRAGQSLRRYRDSSWTLIHILNFGKYSCTVIFYWFYFNWRIRGSEKNATFGVMLFFAVVNAIYSGLWDLLLDWNLFKTHARHKFLRNEVAYKDSIWSYYLAIVADVILRFSFILYVFNNPNLSTQLRGYFVGLLEIVRRWIWNFYRIESEHIGNLDGYRITRDVPLPYPVTPHATDSLNHDDDEEEDNQHILEEELSSVGPLRKLRSYVSQRREDIMPSKRNGPQGDWRSRGPGYQSDSSTSEGVAKRGSYTAASDSDRDQPNVPRSITKVMSID